MKIIYIKYSYFLLRLLYKYKKITYWYDGDYFKNDLLNKQNVESWV